MYGQQKRNIIHKSSTAYEHDQSDQRDELAPFHMDRPLSKPTHWTFVVTPPCRAPSAGWHTAFCAKTVSPIATPAFESCRYVQEACTICAPRHSAAEGDAGLANVPGTEFSDGG